MTYQERSKPQRTLESEVIRSEEVVQELQEEVLPDPWELNNTARSDVELLFFNRVPKVGSQTFMELLRRLAIRNQFGMYLFIILFWLIIVVSTDWRLLDITLLKLPLNITILCRLKLATPCDSVCVIRPTSVANNAISDAWPPWAPRSIGPTSYVPRPLPLKFCDTFVDHIDIADPQKNVDLLISEFCFDTPSTVHRLSIARCVTLSLLMRADTYIINLKGFN